MNSGVGTGEKGFAGELGRSQPGWQSKEIGRMRSGGFVTTLFSGVVVAEFAENDGAHGGAFPRRIQLPIETETLTTDSTLNVLPEVRFSE